MDVVDASPRPTHERKLIAWLAFVGALAALNYAGRAAGGRPEEDVLYTWGAFFAGLIQFSLMLGITLWIARRGPARELLALRRPRSWWRALGLAVLVLIGTYVIAIALSPFLDPGEEQGLTPEEWDPSRAAPFLANFVLVSTFVPVVEELTFRGLGFSLLLRFGGLFAIVASGVIFGLGHGLVAALPVLVAFGIGLAVLRSRSGSVYPSILLHGAFNAFALIASITLGDGGDG
jgi:membrane protease YdiL (CAAX protease family)